jgi:hypothetical protein
MFCWNFLLKKLKYLVYQNRIYGFLLQGSYNSSHSFPKTMCLNFFPLPQIFPLWVVPNHIIMIQIQQKFKIQNFNAPWAVHVLNALFIQIM